MTQIDMLAMAAAAEWFAQALAYPGSVSQSDESGDTAQAPVVVLKFLPEADSLMQRREGVVYCGLFDIGSPDPVAPLQESHYHEDPHTRLRRITNFYRYFDTVHYSQWSPDHICVELTFLAYLLRLAAAHSDRDDLAFAAREFARLHLGSFVHKLGQRLTKADESGVYIAIILALSHYIELLANDQRIRIANV